MQSCTMSAAGAVYKRWLPNTNFETASNWDEGRVPCAGDVIHFDRDKVPLYLPLNGEFILASGAGFAAFDGSWDPRCDSGSAARFGDAEGFAWFDPALWQTAASPGELQQGGRIFAVDEERVPCQYDDVIFQPETSFRVNVDSSRGMIHLRSISLMGQTFSSTAALAEYLRGPSAPLQFHGNGTFQVSGAGCPDKSGCVCGNAQDGHRICAALLGAAGRPCPAPACRSPLRPLGHCCGVCGECGAPAPSPRPPPRPFPPASPAPSLGPAVGCRLLQAGGPAKRRFALRSSAPVIQIVLIDDQTGSQTGTAAEQMAADIMSDIAQHGNAAFLLSQAPVGASNPPRILTGTVVGLLFGLLLLGGMLLLYRRGMLRGNIGNRCRAVAEQPGLAVSTPVHQRLPSLGLLQVFCCRRATCYQMLAFQPAFHRGQKAGLAESSGTSFSVLHPSCHLCGQNQALCYTGSYRFLVFYQRQV
uniref:Protein amnionless n=1 Tax=Apteryx owenii TaxID=8824 RepID=A0A8B9PXJ4_APTOW